MKPLGPSLGACRAPKTLFQRKVGSLSSCWQLRARVTVHTCDVCTCLCEEVSHDSVGTDGLTPSLETSAATGPVRGRRRWAGGKLGGGGARADLQEGAGPRGRASGAGHSP